MFWLYLLIPTACAALFIALMGVTLRRPKPVEHADDWTKEHGLYS